MMSTPLSPLENKVHRTSDDLEGTPVGDRDKRPKIQLCIELRKKEVKKSKRTTKPHSELVLEISVMYLKNLPRRELGSGNTFVKIRLIPGEVIHSTELKMDKQNRDKVDLDFIEVFGFTLRDAEDLKGKTVEVLVCDKKMTRNANIFGKTEINVQDIRLGKPLCQWFNLDAKKVKTDNE